MVKALASLGAKLSAINNEQYLSIANSKHGERGHEVFSKILRGKPNFRKMSENDTKGQTSTLNKSGQSVRRNVLASALPAKHTEEVKNNTKFSRGKKASFSKTKSCPELLKPQILNADKPTVTTVIQSLEFQELQLQSGILEEVRNGEYKIGLAPSDLIDFGGQKSYDMTHQLFIQHRGSFLLMFDGRFGLHNQLLEYPEGVTAADILKHWVDSVLTYIEDTEDIMPMIMFAATHRDQCKKEGLPVVVLLFCLLLLTADQKDGLPEAEVFVLLNKLIVGLSVMFVVVYSLKNWGANNGH
ncbi:unnamed protein product [Mytilus edulis]|uniref:Uncharacterized protein n=1 Tax=Mytilus edulis TaxID=6550 RepID=A0A8S3Q2J3_MYTED|nr:unnamed protein product [Mytilus edulis]